MILQNSNLSSTATWTPVQVHAASMHTSLSLAACIHNDQQHDLLGKCHQCCRNTQHRVRLQDLSRVVLTSSAY